MIHSKKVTAAALFTPKGRSNIPEAIPASTNRQTEKYSVTYNRILLSLKKKVNYHICYSMGEC